MPIADVFHVIAMQIQEATGKALSLHQVVSVGGGCINSTYRLDGENVAYFIKLNRKERQFMFESEVRGLAEIATTGTVRVPLPVCQGVVGDQAFLTMECLQLRPALGSCDRLLGYKLAAMHKIVQPFFGWHWDNTIGSTLQPNERDPDFLAFWAKHRLGFQLKMAEAQGYGGKLQREGEKLIQCLPFFFAGYQPQPSLLHGDLWGGNYAADDMGQPVIFDPACYYGDREADIAMTELFGGFGKQFLPAYADAYPLDAGYQTRKTLYNLYHIINHLNIFGGSYLSQAESMVLRLLAEVR